MFQKSLGSRTPVFHVTLLQISPSCTAIKEERDRSRLVRRRHELVLPDEIAGGSSVVLVVVPKRRAPDPAVVRARWLPVSSMRAKIHPRHHYLGSLRIPYPRQMSGAPAPEDLKDKEPAG